MKTKNKIKRNNNNLILFSFIFILLLSLLSFLLSPFPEPDKIKINNTKQFMITVPNRIEVQGKNECSGFSTAYILRHFSYNITGKKVYQEIKYKIPFSGYVFPKGIIKFLQNYKFKVKIYRGNLMTLKTRLNKGNPIIVLIGKGFKYLHYITIVGYDETKRELYFYDSNYTSDENGEIIGNRTLTENSFLKLWHNIILLNNIYITVDR